MFFSIFSSTWIHFTSGYHGQKTRYKSSFFQSFECLVCNVCHGLLYNRTSNGYGKWGIDLIPSENKTEAGCPFWHLANDGYCDDEANIEECNYDFGDCCDYENDFSACQDCICITTNSNAIPNCSSIGIYGATKGDGICDLIYNNVDYFFDYGDCCLEDPICQVLIYGESWRGHSITKTKQIDCPDNVCIRSDNYCIKDQIGDGICQDYNNSPFCNYDLGDCCMPVRELDFCCSCICKEFECYPGVHGCHSNSDLAMSSLTPPDWWDGTR